MFRSCVWAAIAALAVMQLGAVTVGPDWCVVYPDNMKDVVNRVLKVAAEEVRDDINEATGLELKAVPASKAKPPAICVGAEFAKKAGLDLSGLKWYDNAIAEKGGNIYLYGNDRPGRDREKFGWNIGWFRCVLPSVKAATRFLETHVGVRFLMPGEVGKEVPKVGEVSVMDGCVEMERPILMFGNGASRDDRSMIYRIANGIWGMGVFHTYGGHSYPYACSVDNYFKTHPEYFALRNGKRIYSRANELCISNPDVENLIVAELKRQFDLGAEVCQLGQTDGGKNCECEKCRALFGTGDDWSEKTWLFHRKIAERILRKRPGKIVNIMSYGQTAHPPRSFKVFPSNVMVELCKDGEAWFREWDGYNVPHGFTVYSYLSGSYKRAGFVARHAFAYFAMIARRYRENGIRGVYRCGTEGGCGDLYGTEGPGYYIFNRLLMDGSLNVNSLLVDYCSAAFGPASSAMLQFYKTQDARIMMFDKIVDDYPADIAAGIEKYCSAKPKNSLDLHGWMFSPDTTAQMEGFLSRAEKAKGLSAKHRKRLELVRLEFDYAKMMGAISTLYSAYRLRPSKEFLMPLLDVIEERNEYLDRLFCGANKPRRLDGWPEFQPFGVYDVSRAVMNVNGVMTAAIGAPLTWPIEAIRKSVGVLPGVDVKKIDAKRVDASPPFSEFMADSGWNDLCGISMEPVPVKARFKAMYDDRCLYVLVEGDLDDNVELTKFPHDGPVWNEDAIDMLLAPGPTRDIYYHFIWGVDPSSRYDDVTGLVTDPLDPMCGKEDMAWNGKGWKTESRREGGKWRTIATVPYSDFGVVAPKPGDSWFVNVGRVAKVGESRKEAIFMLWSPNVESRGFVAPSAMGKLIFR